MPRKKAVEPMHDIVSRVVAELDAARVEPQTYAATERGETVSEVVEEKLKIKNTFWTRKQARYAGRAIARIMKNAYETNGEPGTYVMPGRDGKKYVVTTSSCTCEEYQDIMRLLEAKANGKKINYPLEEPVDKHILVARHLEKQIDVIKVAAALPEPLHKIAQDACRIELDWLKEVRPYA